MGGSRPRRCPGGDHRLAERCGRQGFHAAPNHGRVVLGGSSNRNGLVAGERIQPAPELGVFRIPASGQVRASRCRSAHRDDSLGDGEATCPDGRLHGDRGSGRFGPHAGGVRGSRCARSANGSRRSRRAFGTRVAGTGIRVVHGPRRGSSKGPVQLDAERTPPAGARACQRANSGGRGSAIAHRCRKGGDAPWERWRGGSALGRVPRYGRGVRAGGG